MPTLFAYRVIERTPTLVRYERNPYYFKVDPSGQQLPYIDEIDAEIISDDGVVTAKAATGQLDFAGMSLSFLGIGLRPPVVSWGVLMQQAQNDQVIVLMPWLLLPGLAVVITVVAFNLVGDGLRDAADPYGGRT